MGAICAAAFAAYSFVSGELTGDCSAVDRLWSVAPVVYVWVCAAAMPGNPRLMLVVALVTVWGARLTFNFWRKGGYSGMEDYRWEALRKIITNRFLWMLFDLSFIAVYQHFLIFAFTAPVYVAWMHNTPLNFVDALAAAVSVGALLLETAADQQQWLFQESKHGKLPKMPAHAEDYKRGFLTTGLWGRSRHPNFFGEQSFWVGIYLFSVAATGAWINVSGVGAALLIMLFQGSTTFTESLTAAKYPLYSVYQRHVNRLMPSLSTGAIPWKKTQ